MASEQRTEKPTPKRLEKARKEGQFAASKEFVAAASFVLFVFLLMTNATEILKGGLAMLREELGGAFSAELTPIGTQRMVAQYVSRYMFWLLLSGCAISLFTIGIHLLTTGGGLAWGRVTPDVARLNQWGRIKQLPSQNISLLFQTVLLLPVLYFIASAGSSYLYDYLGIANASLPSGLALAGNTLSGFLYKAAGVLFAVGCIDLFRQRRRWIAGLRMTKQEVREEQKDVEGNPLIRMRIRRIQREALRRRMMEQVPKSTAVIVNPTHFAVAIRYQPDGMAAPKVVAKGKNWLALRIREVAIKSQVPIVENPPLAQALYGSTEVGQEIPRHLYQAVAEVLAYIFRLMRKVPGR